MRKLRYFFQGRLFFAALLLLLFAAAFFFVALTLPLLLAPLAAAERAAALIAGVFVVNEDNLAECKTARIVLILLFPWTGIILCALTRPKRKRGAGAIAYSNAESIRFLPDGKSFFCEFLADISQAKHSVYLDFYIIAKGVFWDGVLGALKERAQAGVDVKIIFDGFGCSLTLPRRYFQTLAAYNIACRVFRPVRFPFAGANRRDHRKLAVIDGAVAYTGGINLSDEYIGERIRFGHWKDSAVRVTGDVARDAQACFLAAWEGKNPPSKGQNAGMGCAFVCDGTNNARCGALVLKELFRSCKRRLYVTTPYLAPDLSLTEQLVCAAKFGADVRILIPHVPDKKSVYLLSRRYARRLMQAGVEVREYTPGFIHGKTVVCDDEAFVSSYNLDFRSVYLQAECGFLGKDEAFAASVSSDFLSAWQLSAPPNPPTLWERCVSAVLALFAPLV